MKAKEEVEVAEAEEVAEAILEVVGGLHLIVRPIFQVVGVTEVAMVATAAGMDLVVLWLLVAMGATDMVATATAIIKVTEVEVEAVVLFSLYA